MAITLATSAAADDIIDTTSAHGFAAGNEVVFTALTGGAGLVVNQRYFVVATSLGAQTFRVSDVYGGSAIGFTTDITAGTVEVYGVGTTHHVRVAGHHFLLWPNGYQKSAAPYFGARFSSGNPDYSQLNMWQHFVQECWIGGIGAETWEDDAMYDAGVGVDTTQHGAIVLARDLGRGATGWTVGGDTNRTRRFFTYASNLYCLDVSGTDDASIYKYIESSDTWNNWSSIAGRYARSAAAFSGDMYVGTDGANLKKYNGGAWSNVAKPSGVTDVPFAMATFRERLYVGFGRKIWRLKANDTWDGSTEFFDAHGVDDFVAFEYHLGYLYALSKNGHIIRTDGNTTFDIFQWDSHTKGVGLKSYDGRLFVTTMEYNDDEDIGEGVLYQFSGSAVTELKRWGRVGRATNPGRMVVAARRLFYGASDLLGLAATKVGFGIAVYDAAEDAHSIFASNRDTVTYTDGIGSGKSYIVDDVVYWGGYLFCSVRGHGLFKTRLTSRDITRYQATYDTTAAGASSHAENGGWITSSDFDAGTPGLDKLWRRLTLHADLPNASCSVRVSYSLDGGLNWVLAGTATGDGVSTRFTQNFYLNNIRSPRFKYKLQLEGTGTRSPQVRGFVVSYLPQPEPNWQWDLTLVLAEEYTKLDETEGTMDVDAIRETLENAWRSQQLVHFEDIDGTEWTTNGPGALVTQIAINVPFVGPASDGPVEGTVQVRLTEAVESY